MGSDLNILAIIPARGGSKGLPGKNIKLLNGKPLIGYTIEEAKKSKYITRLILSTDCVEIAKVGLQFGIENPFMRPLELATDTSLAIDNYEYTLKRMKEEFGFSADVLVVLQPTSPLRTVEDIDNAIDIFLEKNADSVIGICETHHPINWTRRLDEKGRIRNYLTEEIGYNRQESKVLYVPNGAVFVFNTNLLLEHKKYYFENTYPYIMSKEKSLDIDDQFDFDLVEIIMKKRENNERKESNV